MNISTVILTHNESLHIERCIKSISSISDDIFVIDSFSNDKTKELCDSLGVRFYQRPWKNYSDQYQWGIKVACESSDSDWLLRMDADETLDDEMIASIKDFIANDGYSHNAAIFNRKHIFMGKWVKHGGRYPLPMIRLFRRGTAHIEERWMDEHIVLDEGTATALKGGFSDDNLNNVSWFVDKHNKYATREMLDIMLKRLKPEDDSKISSDSGFKIKLKRYFKQNIYMKLPYFVRPTLYFLYRYFFQLGFLDGAKGFAYHFLQGFWYRVLVDVKCLEVDREWKDCTTHDEKVAALERLSGYELAEYKS
ncbi:glycosyltransferase family 2 protein [Leucothrix sargassi]|nr:glycosyltransferase family 2 protein [Leucothrix sargassi]